MKEYYKKVQEFCKKNDLDIDTEWIFKALCHSSYANEVVRKGMNVESNERLEFLGDAVLALSLADLLYREYDVDEGVMSKTRAVVASEKVLAEVARNMNIGEYLLLGKGELKTGGRGRDSILADAFEAILGALYLSEGFEIARNFVKEKLGIYIEKALNKELVLDYKTTLQELTQGNLGVRPEYSYIENIGTPQNKLFHVEVRVNGKALAVGYGKTKKAAEQDAARKAYEKLLKDLEEQGIEPKNGERLT